jgi:ABC-type molybdenum transport system ATPase subunit/photorepair protein PhrA
MISIDNLGKAYGKQTLFEGASFKLNQKEKVGLVGRNGHGKTTLLRIITGEDFQCSINNNFLLIIFSHKKCGYQELIDMSIQFLTFQSILNIPLLYTSD